MSIQLIRSLMAQHANALRAEKMKSFFKTGPGAYGEGDQFIGISVPQTRKIARHYASLAPKEIETLLYAPLHEERLLALLILVLQFQRGDEEVRAKIYTYYLLHKRQVNSWDLVDTSAPHIVGAYLASRERSPLHVLARSGNLWERRIAIIATLYFIRQQDFVSTIALATELLDDSHHLIHKAVGWMLREVGKRDEPTLRGFLDAYATRMPRTMLRYSIEKLAQPLRKHYMYL